ncbi:uncharacterized protein LOC134763464 [Penaeus indicus]|uniref:uncharacterized protein LOC134763464 n=1 Tax=Penaeus indicus TaxID=29960 RepID=UPI00300C64A5
MDSEEEALSLLILLRRRRRRRRRALWMHPITASRLTHGQFYMIMSDLRADDDKFFDYFRMTQESFNELLAIIGPHIRKDSTHLRKSIPAEERLAMTLRFLATGCSSSELHYTFRCGKSTARGIVQEVCKAMRKYLHNLCFPELTKQEWLKIEEGFRCEAHFPNCIGAIDGKHVRLIKPTGSGSNYFCYKKYFSMVLLAVCDANYRFTFIDVGSYGKVSDSSIYKNSNLYKKMQQNTLNIPSDKPVSTNGDPLPFVFVGDEAFGLSTHMLRPYVGKNLQHKKKIFNYRLSRARRYIESAFGILTNKWRIFHRPLDLHVENAENIIRACCTLHNFVRERDGVQFENTLNVVGLTDGDGAIQAGCPRSAITIREKFSDYFSSIGSVSWQDRMIGNRV